MGTAMIYKLIAVAAASLAGSVALVAAGEGRLQADLRPRAAAGAQIAPVAPIKPDTGPLPALPRVSFDPPAPMAVIQQVYEFAARHPEVLQHMPCYCGCQKLGHTSNHSCFVKSRAANGRVIEWDTHGIGCAVCLGVGRDAMDLFNSGAKPIAIREAIDKKYGPSAMPTPRPVR